jgi:HlyD family secretion protein
MKITLAVLALVVAAAVLSWADGRSGRDRPPSYVTATVESGMLRRIVSAGGSLQPLVSVDVSSQLSGRIEAVLADFNDPVRVGQPLARLDRQTWEAEVSEARAALDVARTNVEIETASVDNAEAALASALAEMKVLEARLGRARAVEREAGRALERMRTLHARGTLADESLDEARGTFERAQADVEAATAELEVHRQTIAMARAALRRVEAELANARARVPERAAVLDRSRANLERTVIRSPVDGVVIDRNVDEGQTVAASLEAPKLFTVAGDLAEMEVHARVDEADIGRLRVGQSATFTVDAFPERVFEARVVQIRRAPKVVQNVVTYTVILRTANPDRILLPGMTAVVQVVVFEQGPVLKVPSSALRFTPSRAGPDGGQEVALPTGEGEPEVVWVTGADGTPEARAIRVGTGDPAARALVGGALEAGDEVIVGEIAAPAGRRLFGIRIGF